MPKITIFDKVLFRDIIMSIAHGAMNNFNTIINRYVFFNVIDVRFLVFIRTSITVYLYQGLTV